MAKRRMHDLPDRPGKSGSAMGRRWRLVRLLWAAPCSATGLVLGLPALLLGGSARRVDGVIEISLAGTLRRHRRQRLPFGAITFGHVVIGRSRHSLGSLRSHERIHVTQYETWGPLFFAAYPIASLLQLMRGRHPYWHNWFEVQAYAGAANPRGGRPSPGS